MLIQTGDLFPLAGSLSMTQSEGLGFHRSPKLTLIISVITHGNLASYLLSTIVQLFYSHYRFYVNTEVEPPLTTWNHPLGPVSVSPPPFERRPYSPPANNNSSTYASEYGPATGQGSYPSQGGGNSYPQPFGGYGDSRGAGYEQDYPQQNVNKRGLGRY